MVVDEKIQVTLVNLKLQIQFYAIYGLGWDEKWEIYGTLMVNWCK